MMKKVLKVTTKHNIFPSWEKIRAFRKSVTPPTIDIMKTNEEDIEYFGGIHYTYTDAVTITIKQLSKIAGIDTSISKKYEVSLKYGWDGSGGHKIFNQSNNFKSENIIMAMFCILEISDPESKEIIWEQRAPNSRYAQRPLLLLLGKN